jgi:DNA-directed RNA polymerase subunit M/transcription elongation factor TFIIS
MYRNFARGILQEAFSDRATIMEKLAFNSTIDAFQEPPAITTFRRFYDWIIQVLVLHQDFIASAIQNGLKPSELLTSIHEEHHRLYDFLPAPSDDPRASARVFLFRKLQQFLGQHFARDIEQSVAEAQLCPQLYRSQARKVISNLNNKNTGLKERLSTGQILSSEMGTATHQDMWPELWAEPWMQAGHRTVMIQDLKLEAPSLLQCHGCKKYTVQTREYQTRSADEPMTVFCNCVTCGKRWKIC